MYKMQAEGVVFYDPAADDMTLQVLSPKASYELNQPGSLEYTLLPGNVMYDGLQKLKTVVTLEQDGELIFRGRVLETETDLYNQKKVYCEGEMAFLLDSIQRPYEFKGKAADLFRQLVTKHNEQVEEYKRFQIGLITAVGDDDTVEVEGDSYPDTLSDIRSLLIDQYGGYLRIRHEGDARYIDYVDAFNQTCSQEITFGVNILDIENKVNAQDVCTVLVPLGKDSLTIAKVNGGKDYIEDAELVAQYGRIVKSYTWDDVDDAGKLLFLAQEYMQKMKAETTLTITALDLRAAGADVDGIRIGDTVKLNSQPHGLGKEDICTQIELDIERPEKSEYTFGLPRVTLTAAHANAVKSLSEKMWHQHRWLTETETALNINVEAVNLIGHRTTQLEIDVDAAEEAIILKASQASVDVLEDRTSSAEIRLDAAESAIDLKAEQTLVEEQGNRLSTAEIRLDAAESAIELKASADELNAVSVRLDAADGTLTAHANEISLKANKTYVDNLIAECATVEQLNALQAYVNELDTLIGDFTAIDAGFITASEISTSFLSASSFTHAGAFVTQRSITMGSVTSAGAALSTGDLDLSHSHKVTVNDDGTITLGEVSSTGGSFNIADTAYYKNGVSAAINSVTVYSPFVDSVEHPGGTSHLMRVYMQAKASNGAESTIASELISAQPVYDVGYNDGYAAGYQAAKDATKVVGGISSIVNTAQNYYQANGWASAQVDGEQVDYTTFSKAQSFS